MRVVSWRLSLGRVESAHHYAGVLVPLEEAHLYSHSAPRRHARPAAGTDIVLDKEEADGGEGQGMLDDEGEYSIRGLRKETRAGACSGGQRWTEYEIKSKLINKAIQDIGMGPYNWHLFVLCGFGWFADNLWLQGVSLCLPSLSAEFDLSEKTVRYTTSALFVGLSAGSFLWGIGSDFLGRRPAFNLTLLITSLLGIAAAYARSWAAVCLCLAGAGFGVGGNLPVDGALFLEFLPDASSALLTLLSVWWPVEQGWRYFIVVIGVLTFAMFVVRCFCFHLFESPKFLLNRGRQAEAVAVVHGIAHRNGTKTWLTSAILDRVAADDDDDDDDQDPVHAALAIPRAPAVSGAQVLREKLKDLSGQRLRPLFRTRTLGLATALVWFCWASIGMGYPLFNAFLPQYFSHAHGPGAAVQSETAPISREAYRNYAITSVVGVPGSLLAAYLVDHPSPLLGRRGTLAGSTLLSAVFLFLFVTLGTTPAAQLAFSCVEAFAQNIMYGVLYAFTPELFPTPVRGAGTGVASFLNRLTGLMAPVLAANMPGDGATTPIYMSATLILSAFVGMCLIPIETRGAQRL
ncbi:major facilitator superfamily domain-containing protein [Hirsutella rhossiliensis]|uniref:Major facilitator superfamily domain-containing protein n=1 Tax=Hirsutella rhossiliensis TaxID=111463 RepID=A0A9P8MWU7_9HYPO|nr:major facilitator superfamily domain-containing protein [Hirsutella rhossiliensis]KAH0963758.1 major facilitator superfamily domain-containing protein [Hirsutella rhossiliensis]